MPSILEQDGRITAWIQQVVIPYPWRVRTALLLAHSGDSILCYLILILIAAFGETTWRVTAIRLLIIMTINAFPIVLIKYSVRRERPLSEYGGLYRKSDPHSFPSGHAARTFLIAIVLQLTTSTAIGIAALLWASLVTLARVGLGLHHASDAVGGILLGASIAVAGVLLI